MARSLMKSKRAISPILATLLLIVIAVAAIVVTYTWIMTYIAGTEIMEVYAGTSQSALDDQTTSPTLPATLPEGAIVKISLSYNWTAGETYYFKIVSSSGQILDFPEQAPSS